MSFFSLLIVICATAASAATGAHGVEDGTVRILSDEWGVPHIFSDTLNGTMFGFGYAQASFHSDVLLRLYAIGNGRASEFGGALPWQPLDNLVHSAGITLTGESLYPQQNPETLANYDAFAAGFNKYCADFAEFCPAPFNGLLPLSGKDVFLGNWMTLYTFTFAGSKAVRDKTLEEGGWVLDERDAARFSDPSVVFAADSDHDILKWLEIPRDLLDDDGVVLDGVIGSNTWVINGEQKSDGKGAKIVMNPHLLFGSLMKWFEAQLVCEPCDINIYGTTLLGIPGIQIGFNDHLGWSHTVNQHQAYTTYELDMVEGSDDQYLFDGAVLNITREVTEFKVKKPLLPGFDTVEVVHESSVHGYVYARAGGRVLVRRIGGWHDEPRPDTVGQWLDMGRAKTLTEFKDAMRQNMLPMFYTSVATHEDDIAIIDSKWCPDRTGMGGGWDDWTRPQPGASSDNLWTRIHPFDDFIQIENPESGYLQNTNDNPWTMTLPVNTVNPDEYPPYMAPQNAGMSYRTQVSTRLMEENDQIDFERLVELKHETLSEAAMHAVDELLAAVEAHGADSEPAQAGAAVLAAWDKRMDNIVGGATLFDNWLSKSPGSLYSVPWDQEHPLTTPNTIADPQRAVEDLAAVVESMRAAGTALDVMWGEDHRFPEDAWIGGGSIPGNGCNQCFRNMHWTGPIALAGDTFVATVEFGPNERPKAQVLIGYGQASRGSRMAPKHTNDQNGFLAEKSLREVWRTPEELEGHVEEEFVLQY